MKRPILGWSIIELLITLSLLLMLLGTGYSSYQHLILTARRADFKNALTETQLLLERCYSQHKAYQVLCKNKPFFPHSSPLGFYTITISDLTATTYTLTAIPRLSQSKDSACKKMSINEINYKTASNTYCWD